MRLCSIASGSSGNCIYVGSDSTHLLVDAGISGKRVEFGLNSIDMTTQDIQGILVTHEHSDHIKGLGVLARRHKIPIYATAGTIQAFEKSGCLGKLPEGIFREIRGDQGFTLGDIQVEPFRISTRESSPLELPRIWVHMMIISLISLRACLYCFWRLITMCGCCRWEVILII